MLLLVLSEGEGEGMKGRARSHCVESIFGSTRWRQDW